MTDTVLPWGTRERFYVDLSTPDGAEFSVSSVEFAFTADGADPVTWTTATIEDNGTDHVSAYVLVGPTGDTSADVQLAAGRWVADVRWVVGTERPQRQLTLTLV